ncbi:citronellyl-CoA synthetase [Paraperlucidibaca baekdonensis]|uniref:Citronellyl-CoA synthetase n=1 Tax=Paraperlucidibaca baekdonensis TaxID=748120 RepID=A0A3E0H5Y4_9GAMM|nr:long-chain-acyl-CoA synthetase [Paraperlucidibaca baekdonensis]REH38931.1 citronellyl-CoA synthetase [Paraperlucidibaca baekdonensis]
MTPPTERPADNSKKVGLKDIARGALAAIPELLTVNRGLFGLATLKPDSEMSIGRVLERWARQTPDRVAVQWQDRHWTYAEFNSWVNRLAASFAHHGVKSGETVAILAENSPTQLACVAAAVKLGAVAGMLNFNQRGDVLRHSIDLVKPRLLVLSDECSDALASTDINPASRPDIGFFWMQGQGHAPQESADCPEGFADLARDAGRRRSINPDSTRHVQARQPCFFIFTSGTTGLPKASVMTHYRWLASMAGVGNATLRLRSDDVFYCCLPLYHNNALTVAWGCVLSAGATLAIDRKFSATHFWDRLRHHRATSFTYIGELLRYLLNRDAQDNDTAHDVRLITGNGLRPEIWQQFQQRFGIERIYEFYGASESNIGFINAFGVTETAGFSPLPFAIVEFDADSDEPVRNAKGRLLKVKKGGVGLLISEVSERRPFDGYTDPEAGEKKMLRDVFKKGDCYFNTGDLVRDQGLRHIQFVDRVGDTFRWKGENVASTEVEGVLASVSGIAHGAVYGVSVPHSDGRAGMAAITLKPGVRFDGAAVAAALTATLPRYAVPVFIRVQAEQDTTGTFKYRKVELKAAGFDPKIVDDLWLLLPRDNAYIKLTKKHFADIHAGRIQL